MLTPIIEVKNVKKSFRDVQAVRGIDLDVYPGEFIAVLGPNGAGKTTLVEMIEGIQKPDDGTVLIKGQHWKGNESTLNRILGISLQETWFIEKLTVFETLRLFASFYKLDKKRVTEILSLIQLEDKAKAYTKNLSGGQRQRLALGISLLNYPEILLMDEPTTGLDPNARHDIWAILMKLKEERNTSLVLTTHYMEEAEYLCERIIILDNGKILAEGTLEELHARCETNEIIEVTLNGNTSIDFKTLPGVLKVNFNNKTGIFSLEVVKIIESLPAIMKKLEETHTDITSLQCRKLTLDDLFTSLTGRHLNA
jgi:ABC-2 type transport system ATP-binding protein